MKSAYALLKRARDFVDNPENKTSIADLAQKSGIKDPTLRRLLQPGQKHKTLDTLNQLEKAMDQLDPPKNAPQ